MQIWHVLKCSHPLKTKWRYTRKSYFDSSRTFSYPGRNSVIHRFYPYLTWSSRRLDRIDCNESFAGLNTFLSPFPGKHFQYKYILLGKNRNKNVTWFWFYIQRTKLPQWMHGHIRSWQNLSLSNMAKSSHKT